MLIHTLFTRILFSVVRHSHLFLMSRMSSCAGLVARAFWRFYNGNKKWKMNEGNEHKALNKARAMLNTMIVRKFRILQLFHGNIILWQTNILLTSTSSCLRWTRSSRAPAFLHIWTYMFSFSLRSLYAPSNELDFVFNSVCSSLNRRSASAIVLEFCLIKASLSSRTSWALSRSSRSLNTWNTMRGQIDVLSWSTQWRQPLEEVVI